MPRTPLRFVDFARPLDRRAFLQRAMLLTAGGAAVYAVGCGGGDDDGGSGPTSTPGQGGATPSGTAGPREIRPALLTSEFLAGAENRFSVGLLDGQGGFVKDATVNLRFAKIGADGVTGTERFQRTPEGVELNVEGAHTHDNSSGEAADVDSVAFFVTDAPFDEAGRWGVVIQVSDGSGSYPAVNVPFDVLSQPKAAAPGQRAFASHNDTAATNPDTETLCSRDPICGLHDKVIAEELQAGRLMVVQFSTPAFCQTRFCGPVLEVLLNEVPEYKERIDFVHIEVWQDFQTQQARPAMREWNLESEPWTFFVGADGLIKSRLEAIFSEEELRNHPDALLTA
jgi:hypothetical protein